MIEPDIKAYREDVGEYYNHHFSEEELDVITEIIRGNVPVEAMREDLEKFFDDPDIPLVSFFDVSTDEGMLDRLEYDFGYVGGVGTRSVYQPNLMKLEAKLMICKDKLGNKALRDPRTLRELKVRNDWERVRRILIRRYKRYD